MASNKQLSSVPGDLGSIDERSRAAFGNTLNKDKKRENSAADDNPPSKKPRTTGLSYYDSNPDFLILTNKQADNPYRVLTFQHEYPFSIPEFMGKAGYIFRTMEQAYLYWEAITHVQCMERPHHLYVENTTKDVCSPGELAVRIITAAWTKEAAEYFTGELRNYQNITGFRNSGSQIDGSRFQAITAIVDCKTFQCPGAARMLHDTGHRTIVYTGPHSVLMAERSLSKALHEISDLEALKAKPETDGTNYLGWAMMCTREWMEKNYVAAAWNRLPDPNEKHEADRPDSESDDEFLPLYSVKVLSESGVETVRNPCLAERRQDTAINDKQGCKADTLGGGGKQLKIAESGAGGSAMEVNDGGSEVKTADVDMADASNDDWGEGKVTAGE